MVRNQKTNTVGLLQIKQRNQTTLPNGGREVSAVSGGKIATRSHPIDQSTDSKEQMHRLTLGETDLVVLKLIARPDLYTQLHLKPHIREGMFRAAFYPLKYILNILMAA